MRSYVKSNDSDFLWVAGTPPMESKVLLRWAINNLPRSLDLNSVYYSYQRHGIIQFLKYYQYKLGNNKLIFYVPYISCSEVEKEVCRLGIEVEHIKVNNDFKIDEIDFGNKLITAKNGSVVFLTHAYGKFNNLSKFSDLIKEKKILILEDFAHYPTEKYPLNKLQGDVLLYSYRKTLALPFGAKLSIINSEYADFLQYQRCNFNVKTIPSFETFSWVVKNQLKRLFINLHLKLNSSNQRSLVDDGSLCEADGISNKLKRLIHNIDLDKVVDLRCRNAKIFFKMLPMELHPHFLHFEDKDIPYQIVMFVKDVNQKYEYINLFRKHGVQAIDGIKRSNDCQKKVGDKHFLNKYLCLPIHHQMNYMQIEHMVKVTKMIIG